MYKYEHGGDVLFSSDSEITLDLSANINPLSFTDYVREAIILGIEDINRYPDPYSRKLRDKISEFENIDIQYIFCGNGASDIIFRLPLATQAKKIMVLAPTFSDYERSAKSVNCEIVYYYLKEENGFKVDDKIIDCILHEKVDMVFICNPNNPTGVITEFDVMERILECCNENDIKLVVDECFIDFTEYGEINSCKNLISTSKNLIIIKAFTKVFAIPGVRLGYALCSDTDLINKLYFHGADWTVSTIAQEAGIASLIHAKTYINFTIEYVKEQRTYLVDNLRALGFITYDSTANYVFFKSLFDFNLQCELDLQKIRIRSCSNYVGLGNNFYRVAVSTKDNNEVFIDALKVVMEKTKPVLDGNK